MNEDGGGFGDASHGRSEPGQAGKGAGAFRMWSSVILFLVSVGIIVAALIVTHA
ncbi:MAG: hypothetical protein OXL38_08985 [Gammaproteobacteria bacterium]|nr:hypothetical protein [Gammaproteobacteria bacterium]